MILFDLFSWVLQIYIKSYQFSKLIHFLNSLNSLAVINNEKILIVLKRSNYQAITVNFTEI